MKLAPSHRNSGVALVIALAMLVLISGIVIAFMSSVTTDLTSSKTYEGSTEARVLADSAVNLVIGQIREASTQPNEAWISQPGLIRTYDTSGKQVRAYKLYSASSLVSDSIFDPAKGDDLPPDDNWRTEPSIWTDMNEPVADFSHKDPSDPSRPLLVYPIFDGNHINAATGQMALDKGNTPDIEGFKIEDYAKNKASMPVRWLYMLKDGTLAPAEKGANGGEAKVIIPAGKETTPQAEPNTIVARVAFWTDDESTKVNINTAAEGTFWDTPVCNSQPMNALTGRSTRDGYTPRTDRIFEWDLAEFIGAQKEYQRYPGHPATTCLSPIFGRSLMDTLTISSITTGAERTKFVEAVNKIAPRVAGEDAATGNDYSSRGGIVRAGSDKSGRPQDARDQTPRPVVPDSDRLYATIDELLFAAKTSTPREYQTLAGSEKTDTKTREMLEMAKFFITAQSRAPEQNLFNRPRIAIWPVNADQAKRTTFDKLITFCSTLQNASSEPRPFIFDRSDPTNQTADFSSRNSALYKYLQELTDREIPGFDSSGSAKKTFSGKYGSDRDQILTEIYDYIRCLNLIDTSEGNGKAYTDPTTSAKQASKRGQVVPIKINDTRGFGRIATISELVLMVIRTDNNPTKAKLECSLIPELYSPMAGFSALANDIRIRFKDIKIEVGTSKSAPKSVFQPTQPDLYNEGRLSNIEDNESKVGGLIGFRSLYEGKTNRYPQNDGSPSDSVPPNGIIEVDLSGTDEKLTIRGTVTAEIYAPNGAGAPIQTIKFNFPETKVKFPEYVDGNTVAKGGTVDKAGTQRGSRTSGGGGDYPFKSKDAVRTLTAVGNGLQGDMRIVAATENVPEGIFAPPTVAGDRYKDDKVAVQNSIRSCWETIAPGAKFGSLVVNMDSYSNATSPDLPEGINGVKNSAGAPGDWDNGPAFVLDGAFVNKADEGVRRHQHGNDKDDTWAESAASYIGWWWNPQDALTEQNTFFSPNRQISSPVMFGSLPTGVKAGKPWQTLLFRPAAAYLPGGENGQSHPGSAKFGPPDHLLLDLFWMPIVEPYAISEPFATAGKINLNYQIAPFTYIKRSTGMRAVLQSTKITALNPTQPDGAGGTFIEKYKVCGSLGNNHPGGGQNVVVRRNVDITNTLKQFDDRFQTKNKPFISASEICDIPLIPSDVPTGGGVPGHQASGFTDSTAVSSFESKLGTFWSKHKLTGDNSLERPYSMIYPRVTTRSNTYTVHAHVQTLKKSRGDTDKYTFKEDKDAVSGDFRGSFIVERYLDPNLAGFVKPDGTPSTESDPAAALGPYRFRIHSSRQFTP